MNWQHKVQYYETDIMQIVHHSNYIRWFEEARIYLMDEIGFSYFQMEDEGIIVPFCLHMLNIKVWCVLERQLRSKQKLQNSQGLN